jgi:hypothetical protein
MSRRSPHASRWRVDGASRAVLAASVPAGLLAIAGCGLASRVGGFYEELSFGEPRLSAAFVEASVPPCLNALAVFSGFCGVFLLLSFLAGFSRRGLALSVLRKSYLSAGVLVLFYSHVVLMATDAIFRAEIPLAGAKPDAVQVFFWRWSCLWPAGLALLAAGFGYVTAWRRHVMETFAWPARGGEPFGDRLVEDIRTGGRDPRFRSSMLNSFGAHLLVLVILPFLLQFVGCVESYRVPKGSGNPVVALVKMLKPVEKKKKSKKYFVNPNSAIIFHVPDLDDSQVQKKVDDETQLTYVADPNRLLATLGTARAGKMGAGGGTRGGWPDGMENARVRFIRMEYDGHGWDDGMDAVTRADLNFLDVFHKLTGFEVSKTPESHPIALLRKYKKGFAPPFIYMTGDQDIRVPSQSIRILREYLVAGGMLFADCGSPQWDWSFRGLAQQLFPGEPLLVIADDDPIFQLPYTFSNGAPPLWHHGGMRALGIKHKDRWVVFYHPGDINDAWKTGHSGMDPAMAEGAVQMGVNIVYYSFTRYLELTRKYRK